eukprot:GILJ01001847.1.p1 GENE.GILJ01001847.1~~GILJ01001847.1.p1  ORF type:complete len:310 (+),score=47.94 GILJ01001847.1:45-932(+)
MASGSARAMWKREWMAMIRASVEADTWGQVLEATEGYEDLSRSIMAKSDSAEVPARDRASLNRLAALVTMRAQQLRQTEPPKILAADMSRLIPVFEKLFTSEEAIVPRDLCALDDGSKSPSVARGSETQTSAPEGATSTTGYLLPAPLPSAAGGAVLSIRIDRIGLKDAQEYINPFIAISVYDSVGAKVEAQQHTPFATELRPNYVMFGNTVHIQTSLQRLRQTRAAVFFEFIHYKPKKKYQSTRCWTFMEMDEIETASETVLELYAKPTDIKRKKVRLFSVKPLYLHLHVSVNS